jgi:outer membrane receptor protein involved in Fe transport
MTDGTSPAGTIATALSTTFNAGVIQYEGEVYRIDYDVPMSDMFGGDAGNLSLTVEATHTSLLTESVTGTTFTRLHNTAEQPDWVTRFNADYMRGPLQLTYQLFYLSEVLAAPDATIETTPNPVLDSNMTHSLSGLYEINDNWVVRAGVVNLTDEPPSYPNFGYGDILGRRYFVGFTADF